VAELNRLFEEMFARAERGGATQENVLSGADDEIDKLFT
jgi:hypothetical protein